MTHHKRFQDFEIELKVPETQEFLDTKHHPYTWRGGRGGGGRGGGGRGEKGGGGGGGGGGCDMF